MAKNLLEKGILSSDESIFNSRFDESDSIITEQQVGSSNLGFPETDH